MPDWGEVLKGAGRFFEGLANANIINEWLDMDELTALNAIQEFVRHVPTERLDVMDMDLLTRCRMEFSPDNRTKLVKFYAFFKLLEYMRFQAFRGFPR